MATKIVISGLVVVFEQISNHYGQFDDQVDGSLIRGRDVRVSRKKSRKYTHTRRGKFCHGISVYLNYH